MQLSQQMVAMAQYYHFDGWLVNIENPINVGVQVQMYVNGEVAVMYYIK